MADFIADTEDRVALPEARIVKYQYLFDYYDAKDFIMKYVKAGDTKYILKASNALFGLWLQLKPEFKASELASKKFKEINKMDYFLIHRDKLPSYQLLLHFYYLLQKKLKLMKVLDITFPDADIGKDFQRSW